MNERMEVSFSDETNNVENVEAELKVRVDRYMASQALLKNQTVRGFKKQFDIDEASSVKLLRDLWRTGILQAEIELVCSGCNEPYEGYVTVIDDLKNHGVEHELELFGDEDRYCENCEIDWHEDQGFQKSTKEMLERILVSPHDDSFIKQYDFIKNKPVNETQHVVYLDDLRNFLEKEDIDTSKLKFVEHDGRDI